MMNDFDWAELERELGARLTADFSQVLVGEKEDENCIRYVFLLPKRLLTHDEVVATCKEIAPIIRDKIGEKPAHWTAAIGIQRISGQAMGIYYLGWAGHPDEWMFYESQTDHADWLKLYQRLRMLLSAHGVEKPDGKEEGDFSLDNQDDGRPSLRLAIHRIEFLTSRLVAEIQALLSDGYTDWSVYVRLILSFSERVPPDGIVIWADQVVEQWNRVRLKRKLGDRLQI